MKRVLSLLWQGWKKFAHVLGIINTRILLTISYFVILAVASLFARLLRADLIDKRAHKKPGLWKVREPVDATIEACRRQF